MSEYAISTLLGSPSLDFMYISASPPDAPPLSDTTIGCFIRLFFWMAACIIRAIWSEAPPAPAATTISTGLVGSHAAAGPAASAKASVAPAARQVFLVIVSSLRVVGASPQGRPSARCCSALCRFTPLVQGHREPSRKPRLFAAAAVPQQRARPCH